METKGHLDLIGGTADGPLTVALLHHPREQWADEECNSYGDRPATLEYLANRCDLILTGHTHGGVARPDRWLPMQLGTSRGERLSLAPSTQTLSG